MRIHASECLAEDTNGIKAKAIGAYELMKSHKSSQPANQQSKAKLTCEALENHKTTRNQHGPDEAHILEHRLDIRYNRLERILHWQAVAADRR